MIRLLDRYVARQFLRTFFSLLLGLPMLFVIADATDNIDKYLERGVPMGRLALSYVYQVPLFIQYSFPIAALVATVFTIGNMTRHQEISAAKAGGVSFYRLIVPVLGLGVVLSAAALVLGEVVPVTLARRAELLGDKQQSNNATRFSFVYQTENEGVLSARRLDSNERQMTTVVLERNASARTPGMHRIAERAHWQPRTGWMLHRGYVRRIPAGQTEQTLAFDSMRVPGLRETPEELLAEPKEPEEMRYADVQRFITAIERSGGDARSLKVELAQKLALPCAVMIIILFGAPLATSSRRGGAAYGIGISLGITILYMLLFRVGKAVGSSGAVDPQLAAWGPNLLFLAAGVLLLARTRS